MPLAGLAVPAAVAGELPAPAETKLVPADATTSGPKIGRFLALSCDMAWASSQYDDQAGTDTGAIYAYRRSGGTFAEEQKLVPSAGVAIAQFGRAIAADAFSTRSDTLWEYRAPRGATGVRLVRVDTSNGTVLLQTRGADLGTLDEGLTPSISRCSARREKAPSRSASRTRPAGSRTEVGGAAALAAGTATDPAPELG